MNIKKVFVIIVSIVSLTFCGANAARKDAISVIYDVWSFEGWGGPPEQRNDGKTPKDTSPKDYYYMKFASRASAKAVAKKNRVMIQSTCREAARLQGTPDLIRKMQSEHHTTEKFSSNESRQGLTTDCNPSMSASLSQSIKVYECKAIGPGSDPADVSKDNWEECQCVIYAKFPGGRDALVAKAQEIGK
ncbi:lipoprotein LipL21 [Leptospira andrefontaineae]|uniref:Lipoprotein LipL21 n=1 Tax=Leptospira andrefontaineae TaxID=2484976 RepID=A0A4R9H164_9LEPT|nr:lipoprotein LipL21 [Leptospira andrefontaineae]TGK38035.1 lipoprotein LipL21 [Leptospira andrefontaineae]